MAPSPTNKSKPTDDQTKPDTLKGKTTPVKKPPPRRSVSSAKKPQDKAKSKVNVICTRTNDFIAIPVSKFDGITPAYCRPFFLHVTDHEDNANGFQITIATYKRGGDNDNLNKREQFVKLNVTSSTNKETTSPKAIFVRACAGEDDTVALDPSKRLVFLKNITKGCDFFGSKVTPENKYANHFSVGSDLTPSDDCLRPYLGDYLTPDDLIDCLQAQVFPELSRDEIIDHKDMPKYWGSHYAQFMQMNNREVPFDDNINFGSHHAAANSLKEMGIEEL